MLHRKNQMTTKRRDLTPQRTKTEMETNRRDKTPEGEEKQKNQIKRHAGTKCRQGK